MEAENKTSVNYIFYLQLKAELDHRFYTLAEVLNQLNITLVPVKLSDMQLLDRSKKQFVVVMRADLTSGLNFNEMRKAYFDTAMMTGRFVIYDLTSFSEMESATKLRINDGYRYYPLPQNLEQVGMDLAVEYFREKNAETLWPGGKRGKLPSLAHDV